VQLRNAPQDCKDFCVTHGSSLISLCMICLQLDTDKNGLIDFREFVSAAMHVHQLEEADSKTFERRVRKAFDYLDKDRSGFLEPEEIRKELGIKGSVDDIFEEGDVDADGRISYAEFKNIVETISAMEGNWSSLRKPSITKM
jgi:calcium-dependent protein kinase